MVEFGVTPTRSTTVASSAEPPRAVEPVWPTHSAVWSGDSRSLRGQLEVVLIVEDRAAAVHPEDHGKRIRFGLCCVELTEDVVHHHRIEETCDLENPDLALTWPPRRCGRPGRPAANHRSPTVPSEVLCAVSDAAVAAVDAAETPTPSDSRRSPRLPTTVDQGAGQQGQGPVVFEVSDS